MRAFALAACLLLFSTGCSRNPGESGSLFVALETSPNRLDPALAVDVAEGQICSLLYQGLVRFSPRGEIVPDAAKSWAIENGGTRYVFRMDARSRFSDGSRVSARDVTASLERVLAPESLSPRKWVLDRIRGAPAFSAGRAALVEGVSIPDDSTVVIELEKPFRPFLQLLAMPAAYVVKTAAGGGPAADGEPVARNAAQSTRAAGGATRPLGSGRWVLSKWERGDFIELVPNPFHPGGLPAMDRLVFRVIPEAFTRIAEFESGTLDILRIPHAELARFLGDEARRRLDPIAARASRHLHRSQQPQGSALGRPRPPRPQHGGRRRQDHRRPRGRTRDPVGGRRARRVFAGHEPNDRRTRTTPRRRRELLREAGYPDGFDLEIWQRDSPEGNRVVEAVQGYLLEIGIRVRIVKREWSAFKEAVSRGRVDAFFLDWYGDYPDAENFLYPLFHSSNAGGGGNRSFLQRRARRQSHRGIAKDAR